MSYMRIGINASFLRKPGTGIGQVTANFLRKLAEYHVSNMTYDGSAQYMIPDTKYILYTEEPIDFPLPANFTNRHFLPQYWKRDDLIRKWLWERQVAREATKDDCNAFISLYQSSTTFPSPRVNRHPSPIAHTMIVHDIIPRLFPAYRGNLRQAYYWKMVERGITRADRIMSTSEHTKNDLIRELDIQKNSISVAYPAAAPRFHEKLSHEALMAVLQKYDLKSGYIYHGGGLEIRKNTSTLLCAYKQLRDTTENIPPLVISGKIHSKNNTLATDAESLIEDLGLKKNVRLLGFVPDADMPALYQGALFFVYPSLYEGFGLPVLEALSLGTPTLTSPVSSLPEVGGDAVLYADPENAEDMVRQMKRLLTDETLRAALSAKSAKQASRFDWESFTQNVLANIQKSRL